MFLRYMRKLIKSCTIACMTVITAIPRREWIKQKHIVKYHMLKHIFIIHTQHIKGCQKKQTNKKTKKTTKNQSYSK